MFKKICVTTIAASLLFSIPAVADHHHHREKIKEKIKEEVKEEVKEKLAEALQEVKDKDKTTFQKGLAGTVQVINKLSWLAGIAIGLATIYCGTPRSWDLSKDADMAVRVLGGATLGFVSHKVIQTTTAAVMSQEDIKPLSK